MPRSSKLFRKRKFTGNQHKNSDNSFKINNNNTNKSGECSTSGFSTGSCNSEKKLHNNMDSCSTERLGFYLLDIELQHKLLGCCKSCGGSLKLFRKASCGLVPNFSSVCSSCGINKFLVIKKN